VRINLSDYQEIDKTLFRVGLKVSPLYHLEPLNEREEKVAFLKGRKENPQFRLRNLKYKPARSEEGLRVLAMPPGQPGKIFERKKRDVLLKNEIVIHRHDPKIVRKNSARIYGTPESSLVRQAKRILKNSPKAVKKGTVPASELKRVLVKVLKIYGLSGWQVALTDKRLVSVYTSKKLVSLGKDWKFTPASAKRRVIHEIEVHVLRGANGYLQPLKIFATGLPGYLPTEEGMAFYFEEKMGLLSQRKLRDYAARVIGVDSVCQGLDFRRAFERSKKYGFTDNQAWGLTLRVYRGGGYVKDHIYL
jgi:hypothetical protein